MTRNRRFAVLFVVGLCVLIFAHFAPAESSLQVSYGTQGVQRVVYQGNVLEDLGQSPGDAFHIWHMKMTDLAGNPANCAQCGWGETNSGRSWNPSTQTWTYSFSWGSISVNFQQSGDTLNMNVTETNFANSGYILDGATIYPFVLNFGQLPAGFVNASYPQYAYETTGPGVTTADWGNGEVVAVDPNAAKPLYSGFLPTGSGSTYTPIISSTTPDGIAMFLPHNDRPVQPGQVDTFTVSLRFAPSGTSTASLAQDVYQNWAQTWPAQLNWTDRRVIGTAYLATSPQGSETAAYPNNPRRYFNDGNAADFDVTTASGIAKFQARVLQTATAVVQNLHTLNAQGAITWDIEGEQFPQSTTYVCSPDQIAQVAPEMESVITDTSSPYAGMKLDDAYFKTITDAGFRVGVCIRPQQFTLNGDGTAQQVYLPDAAIAAQLIRKMQYAHSRWGATLFYVDSSVEADGAVLDAGIFQQVGAALPDSLIMPEESTPKHYAYTAPFMTFLFHGDLGTDSTIYNYYPHAFSANLINDVAASTLAASLTPLTTSVRNGDVLMAHADYAQANNSTIVQIYQAAGVSASTSTSTQTSTTPVTTTTPAASVTSTPYSAVSITSPASAATLSGMVQVLAQLGVTLDAAGSYLIVDGAEYGSFRATGTPFSYPLDTTTLTNGPHTLQIWAHDTSNSVDLSPTVTVTVQNTAATSQTTPTQTSTSTSSSTTSTATASNPPATTSSTAASATSSGVIVITSPGSDANVSGAVAVTAQVNTNLDAAGSYLMVDGTEFGVFRVTAAPYSYPLDTTLLANGSHTLQIWAHDTSNTVDLSNAVTITVANSASTAAAGSSTTTGSTAATGSTTTTANSGTSTAATVAASSTYPISLTYPANGQGVSGTVTVSAMIVQTLDAAGSHLLLDGVALDGTYAPAAPYLYTLNTAGVTPGSHVLQVWAHDTNNDTLLSNPVTITIQ